MSQRISAQRMSWGLLALSFLLLAFGSTVMVARALAEPDAAAAGEGR